MLTMCFASVDLCQFRSIAKYCLEREFTVKTWHSGTWWKVCLCEANVVLAQLEPL